MTVTRSWRGCVCAGILYPGGIFRRIANAPFLAGSPSSTAASAPGGSDLGPAPHFRSPGVTMTAGFEPLASCCEPPAVWGLPARAVAPLRNRKATDAPSHRAIMTSSHRIGRLVGDQPSCRPLGIFGVQRAVESVTLER